MSAAASFGKRQGGLAGSYRSELGAHRQMNPNPQTTNAPKSNVETSAQLSAAYAALSQGAEPWGQSNLSSGVQVYGATHPVLMRWVSATIDFVILLIASTFLIILLGAPETTAAGVPQNENLLWAMIALWFGYGLLFEASAWQATPGKKITGLVVTDLYGERLSFGRALGRAFGKALSSVVPFYIPYFMVQWTERKQSMHDKICGTLVYRRADLVSRESVFD